MNYQHKTKPFLITLLLCSAAPLLQPLSAAPEPAPEPAADPVAWHVPNAELRVPVKVVVKNRLLRVPVEVAVNNALLRMPPQVYIADLNPLEITGGLAFDPKTKSAIRRDARKPEEKAATIAKEQERYKKAKTKWDPKAYVDCTKAKAARSCALPARRRTPSSRSTNTFPAGQTYTLKARSSSMVSRFSQIAT